MIIVIRIIKKENDMFLYDNKYYDRSFGSGPLILGHFDDKLIEIVKNGNR